MPKRSKYKQLHLADTGKLNHKVPPHFFSKLTWLNLDRTAISSKDFLKLVGLAKRLETLNIEGRMEISEQAIFKVKGSLLCWETNISFNKQFSILVVACLCSYYSVQDIRARGIKLDEKEALFLTNSPDSETDELLCGKRILFWCGEHFVRFWSFWRFPANSLSIIKKNICLNCSGINEVTFNICYCFVLLKKSVMPDLCTNISANDITCK